LFTGIIEELGTIREIRSHASSLRLTIACETVLKDVKIGDSISVNGVCLTVNVFSKTDFSADVIPETFHSTGLRLLTNGSKVNLERAMAANGRFGGHFVSGHVDGTGTIIGEKRLSNAVYKMIEVEPSLLRYMMVKGSVTVDGTSLTIFELTDRSFTISLIPTTVNDSIVGMKGRGETVNIECDMLAKYMERLIEHKTSKPGITVESLSASGFLDN